MEFKVFQKELELQSRGWIPTFHDVSKEIMEIVKASGIQNGTVCIASHHTTCSVMIRSVPTISTLSIWNSCSMICWTSCVS